MSRARGATNIMRARPRATAGPRSMLLNQTRAADYMSKYGVKAIVTTSPTNVAYLTGFDCWLYREYTENVLVLGAPRARKEAFGVLALDQDPVLVLDTYTSLFASELGGVRIQCYGGREPPLLGKTKRGERPHLRFFRNALADQRDSPADALVTALKDADVTSGRVGVDPSHLRPTTRRLLSRALPDVELLDASELLSLIRMVKTEEEIDRLTTASKINENALFASLGLAHEGQSVGELSRRYMTLVSKKGALFDHYFYSPDGLYLSDAPHYRLREGEYTMIDSGCKYKLYNGDMATSILVGKKRDEVVKRYETIWNIIESVADRIGPGTTPSEVMAEFEKDYGRTGIEEPDYQGHGIGLEPREYPIMGRGGAKREADDIVDVDTDFPLEEGMVISLETSLYEFGRGSYEIEKTFVVGKRSLKEITTKNDRSILIV